ncbi:MAG: thiamine diphosphokinase [Clostridiales Family XIII bacterium]|jgi:thiamine pyrophosphokinase|nr:thiamine diphosphokinase [Clostridiales Family XIII bacterium]
MAVMDTDRIYRRCVIISSCVPCGIPEDVAASVAEDYVVCADGGLDYALAAGIKPDVVIGDFDSVGASSLAEASENSSVEIIRLNPEKDDTDMIAAVKRAIAKGLDDFLIIGGLSGRFDHSLGNVQTLSFLLDMNCRGWIVDGPNRCTMIGSGRSGAGRISLEPDTSSYFSVLSFAERSEGVTIRNAKYETDSIFFTHSYPKGVSNEFIEGKRAEITVADGRLLIVLSRR